MCWHVLGLLHRSDRDYGPAIKAYKQALTIDPQNQQILRDLSSLQIQMRDLEGFAVTRNTLLTLKSNAKINWIAFALARHLTKDYEGAVKVIDTYLSTLAEGSPELDRGFESSELALYRNQVLSEMPDNYQAALEHLITIENTVVDRASWLMKKAEYQLILQQYDEAKATVMEMFDRGMTENYQIHSMYMMAMLKMSDASTREMTLKQKGITTLASQMVLSAEQKKIVHEAYAAELQSAFPDSKAVQRIPYALLETDDLLKVLDERCRKDLPKGVPSLCAELCSYILVQKGDGFEKPKDPVDIRQNPIYQKIVAMTDGYIQSLESNSKLSPSDEVESASSTIVWAWFLRASLHEVVAEYEQGIALVEKCLGHNDSVVDCYELKARLLKGAGDIQSAVKCLDEGREKDKSDRYINNQTTKYMLQAGMEAEALKTISLFTRHEGNAEQNLFDMQCSWYELELAECLAEKGVWGRSLKKFNAVVKHFDDFQEDQFDFHMYCLRKITLRAYVSLLKYEDEIFGQPYYCRAASGTIRIYLHLFDNPEQDDTKEPDYSKMTAAEKKKAKSIARQKKKAAEKKAQKAAEAKAKAEKEGKNQNGGKIEVDDDPMGEELMKKNPLDEAAKYSGILARYAPASLETWILRYDVAIRRKKALLALQALYKARAIAPHSSEVFARIVDFSTKLEELRNGSEIVKGVLDSEAAPLLENGSLVDFVKKACKLATESDSNALDYRYEVAKALLSTKAGSASDAASLIVDGGLESKNVSVGTCRKALDVLKSLGPEASDATNKWTTMVQERFPRASIKK